VRVRTNDGLWQRVRDAPKDDDSTASATASSSDDASRTASPHTQLEHFPNAAPTEEAVEGASSAAQQQRESLARLASLETQRSWLEEAIESSFPEGDSDVRMDSDVDSDVRMDTGEADAPHATVTRVLRDAACEELHRGALSAAARGALNARAARVTFAAALPRGPLASTVAASRDDSSMRLSAQLQGPNRPERHGCCALQ
jgi:hypothetical protein